VDLENCHKYSYVLVEDENIQFRRLSIEDKIVFQLDLENRLFSMNKNRIFYIE